MNQEIIKEAGGKGQGAKGNPVSFALYSMFYTLCAMLSALCCFSLAYAAENPLDKMTDDVLSYFKPVTGSITKVEGKTGFVNVGGKDAVRKGMRFVVVREEAPFRHPVTKEPLGKMESFIGRIEIREVSADTAAAEIIEGEPREGDKVRISEIPVNILFCQSKGIDWQIADSYYRKLKETGRFNVIDTAVETDNPATVLDEAKRLKADVALLLTTKKTDAGIFFTRRLFWASDGLTFDEMDTKIDTAFTKDMTFGGQFIKLPSQEARLQIDIPTSAKLLTTCDIDGDGKQEIIVSSGKDIIAYTLDAELHPALGGIRINGSGDDDHIWLDAIDLNKNGRDEIIVTSMKGGAILSSIYEYNGNEFMLLYKADVFMRRVEDALIAQPYARSLGFDGQVYSIVWDGEYKKGSTFPVPDGVNIYDFIFLNDPRGGRVLLAHDEHGFMNVYDQNGQKVWRSKSSTGDSLATFKKYSSVTMVDKGEWSVRDRLYRKNKDILYVKRIPLLDMIKGIGYKKSQIRTLWWNGLSMEEGVFIDNIGGTLLDYTLVDDSIIVLASPLFGVKPGNILKGENPVKTELYIYSLKGM